MSVTAISFVLILISGTVLGQQPVLPAPTGITGKKPVKEKDSYSVLRDVMIASWRPKETLTDYKQRREEIKKGLTDKSVSLRTTLMKLYTEAEKCFILIQDPRVQKYMDGVVSANGGDASKDGVNPFGPSVDARLMRFAYRCSHDEGPKVIADFTKVLQMMKEDIGASLTPPPTVPEVKKP